MYILIYIYYLKSLISVISFKLHLFDYLLIAFLYSFLRSSSLSIVNKVHSTLKGLKGYIARTKYTRRVKVFNCN
jgi:hypothetical protein